jgi:hypothetical protein
MVAKKCNGAKFGTEVLKFGIKLVAQMGQHT